MSRPDQLALIAPVYAMGTAIALAGGGYRIAEVGAKLLVSAVVVAFVDSGLNGHWPEWTETAPAELYEAAQANDVSLYTFPEIAAYLQQLFDWRQLHARLN